MSQSTPASSLLPFCPALIFPPGAGWDDFWVLFTTLTLTRLEKLSSSVCPAPAWGCAYGQVTNPRRLGLGVNRRCSTSGAAGNLPQRRDGTVFQCGQSHPWWGNSFGVLSLWEAALHPVVEREHRSRPCVLPFGTNLTFSFLCLQVAGDADSLSKDKQAESEEEEEGRAPNSPGNPRGTHAVAQSLPSFSGPRHCSAPREDPPPNQPDQWAASPLMLPAQRARAWVNQGSRTV